MLRGQTGVHALPASSVSNLVLYYILLVLFFFGVQLIPLFFGPDNLLYFFST